VHDVAAQFAAGKAVLTVFKATMDLTNPAPASYVTVGVHHATAGGGHADIVPAVAAWRRRTRNHQARAWMPSASSSQADEP